MSKLRKRLSFANVMSVIAVFIALGGSSYAISKLPKNSVGPKQLKKNAVTTAKIKNKAVTGAKIKPGTITGTQVNASTLGTVPVANLANSVAPVEPTHLIGAPGEPTFENGTSNLPQLSTIHLNPAGFYKDHEGIVHLQGVVKTGNSGIPALFTLPPGFRPAPGRAVTSQQFEGSVLFIFGGNNNIEGLELSGKLLGQKEKAVALDGITFRAES
jgi:hypothetical protein